MRGVTDESWADYQIVGVDNGDVYQRIDIDEQNALTDAMLDSGERLDFSEIDAAESR